MNERYEFSQGSSSKFWSVAVKGSIMTTRWGRIGTEGQKKEADHGTREKALVQAEKAAAGKRKKGYELAAKKSATKKSATKKPPRNVRERCDHYGYPEPELRDDGVWVLKEMGGRFKSDQGWHMHYSPKGDNIRAFFCRAGEVVAGKFREPDGQLEFRLKKSVQSGKPWTGDIYVTNANKAFKNGVAGIPIPSKKVKRVEFKVTAFDQESYAIEVAEEIYFDDQGNRLEPDGGSAPSPTKTSVLVEDRWEKKYWRDGDEDGRSSECTFTYYNLEGAKIYEEFYRANERVAIRVFKGKKSYEWNEADGSVSFMKGRARHELTRNDGRPKLCVHSGGKTKTVATGAAIKSPQAFEKRFKAVFDPFLDRGVQFEDHGFLIDGVAVAKWFDVVKLWTLLRDYGGNQLLYIDEPGRHRGKIYWNDHEQGLFAVDCLDDFVEEEGLSDASANEVIEALPYFSKTKKRSLDDLFNAIEWNRPDSEFEFLDSLAVVGVKKVKRKPAKKKSVKKKSVKKKKKGAKKKRR